VRAIPALGKSGGIIFRFLLERKFSTENDTHGVNGGKRQRISALRAASDALLQTEQLTATVLIFPQKRVMFPVVVPIFYTEISSTLHGRKSRWRTTEIQVSDLLTVRKDKK